MKDDRRLTVFLDGWCVLCDGLGQLLIALDRRRRLRLQTQPATGNAAKYIFVETQEGRRLYGEAAVQAILWQLPDAYRALAMLLWLIPRPLQATFYRVVSSRRYRWFGRKLSCSVLSY